MSKTIYHIKLRPLDKFFFGGEQNFDGGKERNYLVHSAYFPQQTALLGLVRHMLLLNDTSVFQNGTIIKGKEKLVEALIGEKSF